MEKSKKVLNSENTRVYLLLAIFAILVLAIIGICINNSKKSGKIVEEVKTLIGSDTPQVIYIMRDGCTYCERNVSNMESIVNEYGLKYYNIDIDDLKDEDAYELLTILGVDTNNFGTPYMVIVKNNEVLDYLSGLPSYSNLFSFLKENGAIADDSKLYLNYIDYSDYKKIIKSNDDEVIVLAASDCQYCLAEHPILIEVAKETGAKINYMYLDYSFNSQEEYDEFLNSLEWLEENPNWGTPTTLIVNNKKVIDALDGYRSKEQIISFYKVNGIVK
ncbi:MAG: thioredoxin family protein [Bacilli bacterium]|nr:thioredoxin family protein [Bacilli bacterium]